ncbi:MAG: L-2-hydroxyglutarate oxidase [Deltaproteobacteria bacterium]|nr:L-2-hydroxyglutarate oxidase [Deltaproteobacteria bacterium]
MSKPASDFLIIGAGIIGLTVAYQLRKRHPHASITIIEKESDVARHSSGRNSGVLHAGFYYSADSLKARFCVLGNGALKEYCRHKKLAINECGKLVVAKNEEELEQLYELERRAKRNGAPVTLLSEEDAQKIEPNVLTHKQALWSPSTATLDPTSLCATLRDDILSKNVTGLFSTRYLSASQNTVNTTNGTLSAGKIINCAGLYADKVAHDFGFGRKYTIIPFKGIYLKYKKNHTDLTTNIYPVPDLRNPFLGVHFTKTVDGAIKIGPTAIPVFWRENYGFKSGFQAAEAASILYHEAILFLTNAFGFRDLAFEEVKKYCRTYLINLACKLVKNVDPAGFGDYTAPGIRAQLLDRGTRELVQDFVVEGDQHSVHVLNAVSPALTCSFPFSEWVVEKYIEA